MTFRLIFLTAFFLTSQALRAHAVVDDDCVKSFQQGLSTGEFRALGELLDAADGLRQRVTADPLLTASFTNYLSEFQNFLLARGNSLIPLVRGSRSRLFNDAARDSWQARKDFFAKINSNLSLSPTEKSALKSTILRTETKWLALKGEELARAHNFYNRVNRVYGSIDVAAILISASVIAISTAPIWAFALGETFLLENLLIPPLFYLMVDGAIVPLLGMGSSYLLGHNPLSVNGSQVGVTGWESISFFPIARLFLKKSGEIIWGTSIVTHEDLNEALKSIPKDQVELFCSYRAQAESYFTSLPSN
jgi:hypothetical protein